MGYFLKRYFQLLPFGHYIFINFENINFKKNAIIIANHMSVVDILLLLSMPIKTNVFVKYTYLTAPVLGIVTTMGNYIRIGKTSGFDANNDANYAIKQASKFLNKNISILGFPEGTRSGSGELKRFRNGLFDLALRTQTDIIPIVIAGSGDCIPRTGIDVIKPFVVLKILDRIPYQTFSIYGTVRDLKKHIYHLMKNEYKKLNENFENKYIRTSIKKLKEQGYMVY